jgi:acetyltransferase-like isoleucine patch superfamily enzyme
MIIKIFRFFFRWMGWLTHFFYNNRMDFLVYICKREFVTQLKKSSFKSFGEKSLLGLHSTIIKPKYISIGSNSRICNGVELSCAEASDTIGSDPSMVIGDNVSIGEYSHITCANKLVIGNGVLTGKRILITDNAHGASNRKTLMLLPIERPIVSNGPVIIENNVWIGEMACIMPNVRIGEGAIVAANSVVTKNVPPFSIVAGIPAKIVNQL